MRNFLSDDNTVPVPEESQGKGILVTQTKVLLCYTFTCCGFTPMIYRLATVTEG